ncbi:MAG: hypothetical protein E7275_12545 [Pseudobutyrivibrio sp.]|jgi:hypothetical protein|uniref:hypothetical protein n=1 Tax=Pseudobutyrivibrio sp. TaxID=2014367 RepID=UPI0025D6D92C|nr:hypothetical protein [Pseudobutyrivibrio sp.]MBE5905096.1 hypothetical protein [Pseudobutyrivibrio sp.]
MKKYAIIVIFTIGILVCGCKESTTNNGAVQAAVEGIAIDEEHFPDKLFRDYIKKNIDVNSNGLLSQEEVLNTTMISIDKSNQEYNSIKDLKGIEIFSNLEKIYCIYTSLERIDVSNNYKLNTLQLIDTEISNVDLSRNIELEDLICSSSNIKELDISNNAKLKYLDCSDTGILKLDVSKNTELFDLNCEGTSISTIDVTNLNKLYRLNVSDTKIVSLDVSSCTELKELIISGTNIDDIDISSNELSLLNCNDCKSINKLDVSTQENLIELSAQKTAITRIDITNCTKLVYLGCEPDIEIIGLRRDVRVNV